MKKVNNGNNGIVTEHVASHIVDWDGLDDLARPVNWPKKRKWVNVTIIAFLTFLTPLASSTVAPAEALVIESFHITSQSLASFVVSIYLVGFAFSEHAASVTASATVVRSLIGAFLPLAGPAMYARLGLGWGNSMLGFIALAMLPLPVVFYYYGKTIRTYPLFKVTF